MSANWTLSHCIGQVLGYNTKPEQTTTDPINYNKTGNCDSDRRNVFNLTVVAQTPKFSNQALKLVASDWKISGIYKFQSGTPLMIQDGTDVSASTINHQQPDLVDPTNVYTGQACGGCFYLNKAAFADAKRRSSRGRWTPYTGNLGWNSIVSPTIGIWTWALSRAFRITERQSIEASRGRFQSAPTATFRRWPIRHPVRIPTTEIRRPALASR